MEVSMKELDKKQISISSRLTYIKLLTKFYRDNHDTISTENAIEYIKTQYGTKAPNTKRLVTIILNTYVLKPRNLKALYVPRKFHGESTQRNIFSNEEIVLMVREAKYSDHTDDMYHCLLIAITTGMRINEILHLLCKDVIEGCKRDPIEIYIRCGKGGKSRIAFIAESNKSYYMNELLPYVSQIHDRPYIFVTKYDNWRKKLKSLMNRCGVGKIKGKAFHGTRSYYATKTYGAMIKLKLPFVNEYLKSQLGHIKDSTTRGYIRPNRDEFINSAQHM